MGAGACADPAHEARHRVGRRGGRGVRGGGVPARRATSTGRWGPSSRPPSSRCSTPCSRRSSPRCACRTPSPWASCSSSSATPPSCCSPPSSPRAPSASTRSWRRSSPALIIAAVTVALEVVLGTNDDDTYTLRVIQRIARRTGEPVSHRRSRHRLPRGRRAGPPRASPRHARRQRARDGALARRGDAPARRVGDRPLVADRRLAGRHPARLQRRHPRLPLGREGDGRS